MKITEVEVIPVSQVVRRDLAIISAAGTHPESHYLFVAIRTDGDFSGFGEATLAPAWCGENQGTAAHLISHLLAPLLVGKDPLDFNALVDSMDRFLIGNPFTKAALEMALLDLSGKIHQVPCHVLLGGARRVPAIHLKFSIGAFSPREAARVARHAA